MTDIVSSSSVIGHPSSGLNGWINLDKPLSISSAHAVAKVKSMLRRNGYSTYTPEQLAEQKIKHKIKIGHAGTLDPLASGILPLALGKATKSVQFMMDCEKAYEFTVTWGQERATDDAAGEVLFESATRPSLEDISTILPQFTGEISQTPPDYSAIKLDGQRAYDMARKGQVVEIKSRIVNVKSLSLRAEGEAIQGELVEGAGLLRFARNDETSFLCYCGKGTYIRSLARDMGRVLGCYGYVSRLRRIKVGKFTENNAISLEILENMVHKGSLDFLQPVEFVLDDILA